jgi:superfamily II DNA/RNA helicase
MSVNPLIIKGLADLGYEVPTPIQTLAIPAGMYRKDVVGAAETVSFFDL